MNAPNVDYVEVRLTDAEWRELRLSPGVGPGVGVGWESVEEACRLKAGKVFGTARLGMVVPNVDYAPTSTRRGGTYDAGCGAYVFTFEVLP